MDAQLNLSIHFILTIDKFNQESISRHLRKYANV